MWGINKIIRILIASDFFLQAGWGLSGPIFAIFLTQQIGSSLDAEGKIRMVGLIAATYWITKSVIQPFLAKWFDKNHGEKDDFIFLVVGMYVANLIPLGYVFSSQPWHIFTLEFIRGLAMACVVPTWSGIFTRHIDKGKEAFSWSLESTGIGFAAGFAGALGGFLAGSFGFKAVFVLVSFFGIISSSVLFLAKGHIFSKEHFAPVLPPNEKPF
jgi:MFS family permease